MVWSHSRSQAGAQGQWLARCSTGARVYVLWPRPDGTGTPLDFVHRIFDRQEQHSA